MRPKFNDGQEVKMEDLNNIGYTMERQFYERFVKYFLGGITNAFFGNSLACARVNATTVSVAAGLGFQQDNSQVAPQTKYRPIWRESTGNLTITAAHATLNRIDIVCVKAASVSSVTESRKFKDATTKVVSLEDMTVLDDWQADVIITAGTPSGSPAAPATPSGYIRIAKITVTAATGIASAGDVVDERVLMPLPTSNEVLTEVSATYSILASDQTIIGNPSGGSFVATLPALSGIPDGKRYKIKNRATNGNTLTVQGNGSELIDNANTFVLNSSTTVSEAVEVVKTSGKWMVF